MTEIVHTDDAYRNVGMIQVINEPLHGSGAVDSLRSQFYPDAYNVRYPHSLLQSHPPF